MCSFRATLQRSGQGVREADQEGMGALADRGDADRSRDARHRVRRRVGAEDGRIGVGFEIGAGRVDVGGSARRDQAGQRRPLQAAARDRVERDPVDRLLAGVQDPAHHVAALVGEVRFHSDRRASGGGGAQDAHAAVDDALLQDDRTLDGNHVLLRLRQA